MAIVSKDVEQFLNKIVQSVEGVETEEQLLHAQIELYEQSDERVLYVSPELAAKLNGRTKMQTQAKPQPIGHHAHSFSPTDEPKAQPSFWQRVIATLLWRRQ